MLKLYLVMEDLKINYFVLPYTIEKIRVIENCYVCHDKAE